AATAAAALLATGAAAAPTGKWFDHYVIVVFENEDLAPIIKNQVFANFAASGLEQTNYHGTAHPSQPNYWSMVAGNSNYSLVYSGNTTTAVAVNGDNGDSAYDIPTQQTIANLLYDAGVSFKSYSEDYPTPGECFLASGFKDEIIVASQNASILNVNTAVSNKTARLYARKHNPFISFPAYVQNTTYDFCSTQVGFNELWADMEAGTLPAYSFVVPNQLNDEHDTTVDYAAAWLEAFLAKFNDYAATTTTRVLLHINYDEDDSGYTYYYNDEYDNSGVANP
ncbi:hypothetical protein HK405_005239, partial [Cladochytrium tenue]